MAAEKSILGLVCGRRLAASLMRLDGFYCFAIALLASASASAETSSEFEIKTDDRFRGRSLSNGNPVIDVDINVDMASGIYAGASTTFILSGQTQPVFQGVDGFIGFATRIDENVTLDVGVAGYAFTKNYSGNADDRYAEIYAGLSSGNFAAYVHYTSNYFDESIPVIYGEINFSKPMGSGYAVKAHAGLLAQTSGPSRLGGKSTRYDARVALSRPLLGLDAEIAWTYAGPNDRYFDGPWDGNSALVFSIAKNF